MPGPEVPERPTPARWRADHARRRYEAWEAWNGGPPPPVLRTPRRLSLWAPVAVSFVIQVPAAVFSARLAGFDLPRTLAIVGIALIGPLALIAARRFPGPVVAITAVAATLDLIVNTSGGPPYLALAFAIVSAIVRGARIWAWISISVCWGATITVAIVFGGEHLMGARVAFTTLGILVVVGIGEAIRGRRERNAEFQRMATQRRQSAVQGERVRIARELHDVLAHSLSQINVQAGVGLHLMDKQPEKAAAALASIKETSKTALDEVRSVLGVLRAEGGADPEAPLLPGPGLDRLAALAGSVAGVRVELDDHLRHDEVSQPVQLAIYRIVQESLTNVARHAVGAASARVLVESSGRGYRVTVRDDGAGTHAPASESGGRGVLGMRERAELLGGHLSAGPAPDGGFEVVAELPATIGAAT